MALAGPVALMWPQHLIQGMRLSGIVPCPPKLQTNPDGGPPGWEPGGGRMTHMGMNSDETGARLRDHAAFPARAATMRRTARSRA